MLTSLGFDLQQIRKQRDPLFRKNVLRAYKYQCAICGFNMRHDDTTVALEAAHIKWKQHGGPCEIPNGLALCAIHHKAFDKGSDWPGRKYAGTGIRCGKRRRDR